MNNQGFYRLISLMYLIIYIPNDVIFRYLFTLTQIYQNTDQ